MSKAVSPLHVSHVHMSQVTTCALKATAVHPRMAGESERERERDGRLYVRNQECQDRSVKTHRDMNRVMQFVSCACDLWLQACALCMWTHGT